MKELKNFLSEKESLKKIADFSKDNKIPVISNDVGRLLETIIFLKQPENILEIGCGEGYSTYYIIKNLGKGSYTGIDLNKKRLKKAERFISSSFPEKEVLFINGNALKIIPELEGCFDFVFIDAAKFEYPDYFELLQNKLSKDACIIADNVFFSEKIFSNYIKEHDKNSVTGLKEFVKHVSNSSLLKTIFLDIGDGVSVSVFRGK
ncbi:MAG TPA: methyltransferase domain-containing protein [Actinobacteria bacterium]|jgi:predicted O-methyltransferase YrrM|nr:methyltransferase domain-containing protein [Actinomycetota bacterium]